MKRRIQIQVRGRVQGVGFRPTVFRYATDLALTGFVRNTPEGVLIEAEGESEALSAFVDQLSHAPPPQARIDALQVTDISPGPAGVSFVITPSARSGNLQAGMPPDLAVCADCRAELFDPQDRRYHYPFINCTNCGPRFTIIRALPYDRERTSMNNFELCPACRAEYLDPSNRRFDAQPNACPICGPRLQLLTRQGPASAADPLQAAIAMLKDGSILAVKGLGGYHLCCDARRDDAVLRLRQRKRRPHKSLAVMFASLDQIRAYCEINADDAAELVGPAAPIIIARRKPLTDLSKWISPDTDDLGVFLPYSPLHHLLLAEISPLIMTSGNLAEEPIAMDEPELVKLLEHIADAALTHNRPIVRRCDDSVLQVVDRKRLLFRRSRGLVPDAISLPLDGPPVLACGAELKNTICITRGAQAFLSQHIGDLEDYRAYRFFSESIEDFTKLLQVRPTLIAHDLHPDYLSTRYALSLEELPRIGVQHHHAHIAACMAEHRLTEPVIGVALDGTGYGPDGTIWGGEFLTADLKAYRRVARFKPYRMPGGEEAIRQPTRMAVSYLHTELPDAGATLIPALFPGLSPEEIEVLVHLLAHGLYAPWTSSAGRLFDAVSALLGLCGTITYEGQAAIRLQTFADPDVSESYPVTIEPDDLAGKRLSFGPMIHALVEDLQAGNDRRKMAGKFHNTVAEGILRMCEHIRSATALDRVVLSGGVFQNSLLLTKVSRRLLQTGFTVYSHHLVPPNDGGIALGQAVVALANRGNAE